MAAGGGLFGALRNLSLKAASVGIERVCRLLVVLASVPVLGEAAFGRFVFASMVTALLALASELGLGVWTTRALARSGRDDDVVRLGLRLRALMAFPYAVAVAGVAVFGVHQGEERAAVVLLGVAALANLLVDHIGAVLRGYEQFGAEARLNGARAVTTAVAGLGALLIGRSLTLFCFALAAAGAAGCAYGLATLLRLHPIGSLRVRAGVGAERVRAALRDSLPLWLAGVLSMAYFKVDTLFVRALSGAAELGAYGAAFKVFEGTMIVPSIVLSVAFPRLARAHGDAPLQRRIERHVLTTLLALGVGACAVSFLGSGLLVRVLFGAGFARAEAPLRVLAAGLPLVYLNYGLTHFLIARDLGRATTWLSLVMLALNVALDAALIPRGGGVGAAWATVLTEVALTAGCLAALHLRTLGDRPLRSARRGSRTDQRAA